MCSNELVLVVRIINKYIEIELYMTSFVKLIQSQR